MKNIFFFLTFFTLNTALASDAELLERIRKAVQPEIGTKRMGAVIGVFNNGEVSYLTFGDVNSFRDPA